jgi:hypothetical protein
MMSERDVWLKTAEIVAAHGTMTADFIIGLVGGALGNCITIEDWRRIAAAVDAITEAKPQ